MHMSYRRFLVFTASLFSLSGVAFSEGDATKGAPAPTPETIIVQQGSGAGVITLGGTVMPAKMVTLSAQMPGDVEFIAGEEGDRFHKGAALVKLDTKALLDKRKQALAQLASAQAGYRNAIAQYRQEAINPNAQSNSMMGGVPGMMSMFTDPMRSFSGQGSPGVDRQTNMVGRGVQVETARNQIAQARAAIAELDESLENAVSRAPFNGVIVKKMVEVGDIVQPGMPLITFADTHQMQIRVEVPSRLISSLHVGMKVMAHL